LLVQPEFERLDVGSVSSDVVDEPGQLDWAELSPSREVP
jgi:hypothetical protein